MPSINSLLFNISMSSGITPEAGSLLVAEPFLAEPFFHHGVVLLIDTDEETDHTAMGVVLNLPIGATLHDALPDCGRGARDVPLYCGGPLSHDRLYFIHRLGPLIPDSRLLRDDLYVGGDFEAVMEYIEQGGRVDGMIRFFVGYSGWSRSQLDEEISSGVWAVASWKDPREILTGSDNAFWHRCVRSLGTDYRGWLYHPRDLHSN